LKSLFAHILQYFGENADRESGVHSTALASNGYFRLLRLVHFCPQTSNQMPFPPGLISARPIVRPLVAIKAFYHLRRWLRSALIKRPIKSEIYERLAAAPFYLLQPYSWLAAF
jgi:hypothetical protein